MADPFDVPRPIAAGPSDFSERLRALRGDARVGAAVLACVAIAAGVAWFRAGIAPSAPKAAAPLSSNRLSSTGTSGADTPTTDFVVTTTTGTAAIVIDVVGAVRAPGVVSLPASARVIDAIRAAGGATPRADLTRLNLAAKLADGTRIAVPLVGQPPPALDPAAVSGSADSGTGDPGVSGGTDAPINVNTATSEQLEDLPGIGPTLAAAIVQERERNGTFKSIDDLNRVPGIGPGRLAQLHDLVSV
jgi:competence protein ComEA